MKNLLMNYFIILGLALSLSACNGVGTAKFDEAAVGTGETIGDGIGEVVNFSGITSISNVTDSTLTLNWTNHASASAYQIYRMVSGSPSYLATVAAPASSLSLTGLVPNTSYTFRVRALDSTGTSESNTAIQTVTTNLAPNSPSGLTLITPASSPGFSGTPTIRVSGVKSGDTIKLFTDATCATQVASASASGSTIDLTTSMLGAGTYNFYSNSTNGTPSASACSTATVAYQKPACPTGYVPVAANATFGTSQFCVMQFEAKSVASVATSQAAGFPWGSISQTSSKAACTALGTGYDLISNPEWMTIAYDIEATASNWSGGVVGTGALFRGHTDNAPASALAVTNTADLYDGTGNTSAQAMGSGREQRRTFTLSNGEVVWDIVGNVWEWTDWTLGGSLASGPTSCTSGSWTEFPGLSCGALAAADYMPGNPAVVTAANYNANYGLGRFYGGAGGAALRGGDLSTGTYAGAFALTLNAAPSNAYTTIGFRCVYRF